MPTTIQEQLLAGIHQTEKQLPRVTDDAVRADLTTRLDAYLEDVRAADTDARVQELFPLLHQLHLDVIQATA